MGKQARQRKRADAKHDGRGFARAPQGLLDAVANWFGDGARRPAAQGGGHGVAAGGDSGAPAPGGGAAGGKAAGKGGKGMQADWTCLVPGCAFSNFGRRPVCWKCGVAKGSKGGVAPPCPTHRVAGKGGGGGASGAAAGGDNADAGRGKGGGITGFEGPEWLWLGD